MYTIQQHFDVLKALSPIMEFMWNSAWLDQVHQACEK